MSVLARTGKKRQMSVSPNSKTKLTALVLAGAPASPEMEAQYSIKNRAELPIAGKMMVQYVIDALKASEQVGDIYLVGNTECEGVDKMIAPSETLMENLIKGLESCATEANGGHVLVATSDIPLVTSEAIDDFISRCGDRQADFYYSIVSKVTNEKRFPGMKRTYVRLAEGTMTGGNLMVINPEIMVSNGDLIREILNSRKSIKRLARLIGIGILIRAVIAQTIWSGAINIPTLEKTVGRIIRAKLKAVETPFPEIGADVDDAEHIPFAEAAMKKSET